VIAVSSAAYAVITMTDARGFNTRERSSRSSPLRPGHHDVGDDDVEVLLLEARQGLLAACRRRDAIALGRQGPGQDVLDRGLVVYYEN